jgi:trans-aconitate methyltransferase
MNRYALIKEYNKFYKRNPEKWTSDERDEVTYQNIAGYLKQIPWTVLDIGCGNGHTIAYLHKKWPETDFAGIDLSPEAIAIAKKKAPSAQFFEGFLDKIKSDRQFDVVILLGVAEHFEDIVPNLILVRKLINHNGIAYIEVPNCIAYPTSAPVEGFRRVEFGSRQTEWHLLRETWEKHLSDAGLEIVQSLNGPHDPPEFIWIVKNISEVPLPSEQGTSRNRWS